MSSTTCSSSCRRAASRSRMSQPSCASAKASAGRRFPSDAAGLGALRRGGRLHPAQPALAPVRADRPRAEITGEAALAGADDVFQHQAIALQLDDGAGVVVDDAAHPLLYPDDFTAGV